MGVGRKRLPDAVHKRRGTFKPSRHGDPASKLQLEAHIGEPPDWLNDSAKREWFRVAGAMKDVGVFTRVDRGVLTSYCVLWAKLETSQGADFTAADFAQFRIVCSELGFTPSSRSKIVVPKPEKPTGFGDL